MVWFYRFILYMLLFGVCALSYGGNALHPLLDKVTNGIALIGIASLVICYFRFPPLYKLMAWVIFLGVILLVLESKYEYDQYVYSYFVIKRFAYCALAFLTYYVATKVGTIRIDYIAYLVLIFFFINQILLGQIFTYSLSSESRTTTAPEALYLVFPFLYFLVLYLKNHRFVHLFISLATFLFIVILLHRSVISTAVGTGAVVLGLSMFSKRQERGLPFFRTLIVLLMLGSVSAPMVSMLSEKKFDAFVESMNGLLSPKEDNTGSWRLEQTQFYMSKFPERPLLGWRYDGYDRGEIMKNVDFPQKGTIIHSQYVDMLYNYGIVGLVINLIVIIGTFVVIYRRKRVYTVEQLVLGGFIFGGLFYGLSYQLPVYYWSLVGLGMFFGLHRSLPQFTLAEEFAEEEDVHHDSVTI